MLEKLFLAWSSLHWCLRSFKYLEQKDHAAVDNQLTLIIFIWASLLHESKLMATVSVIVCTFTCVI